MSKKKILLVGSANMDLSMSLERLPAAGETLIDNGGIFYNPGGKGANAAVAITRLGGECIFSAKLGADSHGQRLFGYYKSEGIDTGHIKVDSEHQTGLAVVIKEASGENRIVVYPGANAHITEAAIREAFDESPDAVYLGFEVPFETTLIAARLAAERGVPIFLDAAPADKNYPLESLPELEVFSPNETETLEYTGIMPTGIESSLRASLALYKRVKCKYIVIKQGDRGAFLYDGKRYNTYPAYRVGKVVDTTAAGDTFTAALTLEYARCGDIDAAIRFANAAGAITVTRRGAASSIPTEAEVLAVLESGF